MPTPSPTSPSASPPRAGNKFGTFGGVFTPSILTILGVIMFLRAGFVVGQAGMLESVAILVIAEVDRPADRAVDRRDFHQHPGARGRGLLPDLPRAGARASAASIGIALFFAQALSVPFYILGFTEALVQSLPGPADHVLAVNLATAGGPVRRQLLRRRLGDQDAVPGDGRCSACRMVSFLGGAVGPVRRRLLPGEPGRRPTPTRLLTSGPCSPSTSRR